MTFYVHFRFAIYELEIRHRKSFIRVYLNITLPYQLKTSRLVLVVIQTCTDKTSFCCQNCIIYLQGRNKNSPSKR
jgi:hypothetical protein